MSNVKQLIPESIRQKWHEWWHSIKDAETEKLGNDHISDKVEMAGWGVKQAQEQHAEEASTFPPRRFLFSSFIDLSGELKFSG